jgi:hypothetical protein
MSESIANGISITNSCYECQVIAMSVEAGHPEGKCFTCLEQEEANADTNAWNLHEDDRLGEGPGLSVDTSDSPSSSEWVSSQTYTGTVRKARMIEKWVSNTGKYGEKTHLESLTVEFEEAEPDIRHEFLPPIAQLIDGGEFEELWELDDMIQRARETECQWCHLLTPKVFNDCQSCDKPLELNVR